MADLAHLQDLIDFLKANGVTSFKDKDYELSITAPSRYDLRADAAVAGEQGSTGEEEYTRETYQTPPALQGLNPNYFSPHLGRVITRG